MLIWLYLAHVHAATRAVSCDLSTEDADRLAKMISPRRREQFIAGRRLAHYAIEQSTGIPVAEQRFATAANGKPYCIGGPSISLSHSEDWIACGVACDAEIGLDLQFPVARADVDGIASRYFGDSERAWIAAGGRERFFMLWALKEAHLKVSGMGLGGGMDSVVCQITPPRIEASFATGIASYLSLYAFGSAFLAVAATSPPMREARIGVLDSTRHPELSFIAAT